MVEAEPAEAAIGGKRAAILMPFSGGGSTLGSVTLAANHSHYFFPWATDLHAGQGVAVEARFQSSDGVVTLNVLEDLPLNCSPSAGSYVKLKVSVDGVEVGQVVYEHLMNAPNFSSNQQIPVGTRLGDLNMWSSSSCWQVNNSGGIHTHFEAQRACYRSLAANTAYSASTAIGMLSSNYSTSNKSVCDESEVNQVVAPQQSPVGSYELLSQIPGGFRVAGWAKDPDTNDPINVHVYIDGAAPGSGSPVGGLLANNPRPDVGNHAYDGLIAYSGTGSHNACVWAVNVGSGSPTNLGCKTVDLSHSAVGSFDLVQQGPSRVRVAGWALDRDSANPVTLHVYVGSTLAGAITANGTRTDVGAAYPGYGDNHGYDTTVSFNAAGTHNVCVWALNDGTAGDNGSTQLGCRSLTINNDPVGNYEMIAPGNGGIRIGGWGLDRSVDGPAWIHVYVDGSWGGAYQANVARSDIGAAFPGYGDNHGFDVTIPWAAGTHTACAWVVGDNIGGGNFGLGCKTVTR